MAVDPHALAEARSIAMHAAIVEQLRAAPELLVAIARRVAEWNSQGRPYAQAWADLLAGDREQLFATMTDSGERARALRQCTPFAGLLDARERWRIRERVRVAMESAP